MLTKLHIRGFKNLKDVELYFGPFTCIAGENAVGKSNLFDAIMLLGALTDSPVLEAAMSVRDTGGKTTDIRSLFHATSSGHTDAMSLDAEMIISSTGTDDLGQPAKASTTFLRYAIELELVPPSERSLQPGIRIAREELSYIPLTEAHRHLPFKPSTKWRRSVLRGRRTSPFISTVDSPSGPTIRLHQDGRAGRTRDFLADSLPRTVLSSTNAAESATALLARREMQSWRLLQLEPTALRSPDPFSAPVHISSSGAHVPATIYSLARRSDSERNPARRRDIYALLSNRLSELVEDVKSINVERDNRRELLTLHVTTRDGTSHPSRSLSDGTLRFLALSTIEVDPDARGLLCFEEPENGINPARIVAMVGLLTDLAVDIGQPVGEDNPLRQVIVNTHSPTVMAVVPQDSLLLAEAVSHVQGKVKSSGVVFRHLSGTWRDTEPSTSLPIAKGRLLGFLSPVRSNEGYEDRHLGGFLRVIDRDDLAQLLLWEDGEQALK